MSAPAPDALLRHLRTGQDRALAAMASEPGPLPASCRVRAASEHLLLLGAGLTIGGALVYPEALHELAARATIELALALRRDERPLGSVLDLLARLQARRLPSLLAGRPPVGQVAAERHLGIAFESLSRMLGILALAPERPRVALEAADAANRIVLALSSLASPQPMDSPAGLDRHGQEQ